MIVAEGPYQTLDFIMLYQVGGGGGQGEGGGARKHVVYRASEYAEHGPNIYKDTRP